jgi:hypothetical protein
MYLCVIKKKNKTMTIQELKSELSKNGLFSVGNEAAGWYAISKDGKNMITYYNTDTNKFYTEQGFIKRINQLVNRGY